MKQVRKAEEVFQKGDVIGCLLDLTIPQMAFTYNGSPIPGLFSDFNVDGMFFPVVTMSAAVRLMNTVSVK